MTQKQQKMLWTDVNEELPEDMTKVTVMANCGLTTIEKAFYYKKGFFRMKDGFDITLFVTEWMILPNKEEKNNEEN